MECEGWNNICVKLAAHQKAKSEDGMDWLLHHCSLYWRTKRKYHQLFYVMEDWQYRNECTMLWMKIWNQCSSSGSARKDWLVHQPKDQWSRQKSTILWNNYKKRTVIIPKSGFIVLSPPPQEVVEEVASVCTAHLANWLQGPTCERLGLNSEQILVAVLTLGYL
jgi:hypothetical protein